MAFGRPIAYLSVEVLQVPQACRAWRSPNTCGMQNSSPPKSVENVIAAGPIFDEENKKNSSTYSRPFASTD